ncbi:MAG TPA: hypothetical protein VFQ53_16830 [Kofleriaceae bacterium]|nr:hypothetical protein [Kofleriaceae bacterium]
MPRLHSKRAATPRAATAARNHAIAQRRRTSTVNDSFRSVPDRCGGVASLGDRRHAIW